MKDAIGLEFSVAPLLKALASSSEAIKASAGQIVERWSQAAAGAMRGAVPLGQQKRRKGPHLRDTVKVTPRGPLAYQVAARAPHAHLWEAGTVTRFHRRSGKSVGRMPAANRLIPIAMSHRGRMLAELERTIPNKDLV